MTTEPLEPKQVRLMPLAIFTASYLGIAVFASLRFGNKEFLFYIITMLLLIAAVMGIHQRMPMRMCHLWSLTIWGLAHMAGGLLPIPEGWSIDDGQRVLYSLWLLPGWVKYDQLIHAYGFAVTTWLCWHGLSCQLRLRSAAAIRPSLGLLTLAAAGGMGFGALNEVIEFIAVLTIPDTNVGGYENTGWDLVFNLIGCITAATLIRCRALA
jgi:hypothetical protein